MVRKRATRFTTKPPPDSISVISQVVAPTRTVVTTPTPTTTVRTTRATRFTPTPTRPTGTITRRVTVSPTPITVSPTPRTTRFTPRPTPPRDDFQRSLSVFPVVRQAFAQEAPRQQAEVFPVERAVVKRTSRLTTPRITPVRATPKAKAEPKFRLTEEQRVAIKSQPKVPLEVQQAETRRLRDLGVPTFEEAVSERDRQFGSFGGGVVSEIQNLRSIVDPNVIPTREVGSLAFDLPFAVAGETFTRPSAEGEAGFLGLGFDFRSTPDFEAGAKISGEIQEEIGEKFEEDPARAVGSIFAIGAVEAGLLITTGGVGNLARRGIIQVGKQIATTKGRKLAEKVAKQQPAAKKGIPQLIENLGDGRFAILQGFEEIGKRVGSIRVLKGGGIVAQTTTKSGKVVEKELDLITGITRFGTKGKLKGKTIKVTAKVERQADVPLIIVDTKSRLIKSAVSGRVIKSRPRTRFFNKNIPDRDKFLDDPELLNIVGADIGSVRIVGKKTGLKAVKGKQFSLVSEGKIPEGTLRATAEAEKFGQIRASARGISVLTKDASSKKGGLGNIIGTFAVRQEPIVAGRLPRLSSAEIIEGIRVGAPTPPTTALKGIPFASTEIFGARTVGGRTLSEFLSPDPTKIPKVKPRPKGKKAKVTAERKDDFDVLNPLPTKQPRAVLAKAKPSPTPRTRTQDVFEAFTTTETRVRPVRVPIGVRATIAGVIPTQIGRTLPSTRVRERDDFALIQGDLLGLETPTGQRQRQDPFFEDRPIQTPFFPQDLKVGERLDTPQVVIPVLDTGIFVPPTTFPTTTTKPPVSSTGGGLPPIFDPFGAERRERRKKKGRRSRLGGRLFDVADEPFGEVAVGLGFFVETERGETSIEEALGSNGFDDEPITRQEKQARARLGRGRKRKNNNNNIFDFENFF